MAVSLSMRCYAAAVPKALDRYAEIADALVLGGNTKEEKVCSVHDKLWLLSPCMYAVEPLSEPHTHIMHACTH